METAPRFAALSQVKACVSYVSEREQTPITEEDSMRRRNPFKSDAIRNTARVAGLAILMVTGAAQAQDLRGTAQQQISAFFEAIRVGPAATETVLAPEFQMQRNNGVGYDRTGYVSRGVAGVEIHSDFVAHEINATRDDDIMVVRYIMEVDEVIDGIPVASRAPRLTVFRLIEGQWKVTAHSNFGVGK